MQKRTGSGNGFMRNIPNIISGFRILLVGVFAVMFANEKYLYCLAVYGTAFISDILDGYLARRNDWITSLGKLIDPLADKLMLLTALCCFAIKEWIPTWIAITIAAKELTMCVFGVVLYFKKVIVEADFSGKIATGLWTGGVVSTLLQNSIPQLEVITPIIFASAVAASLLALLNYSVKYVIRLPKQDKPQ